jgi:hypothetical protein
LACNRPASEENLSETQIALNVRATTLARESESVNIEEQPNENNGLSDQNIQLTEDALNATQMAINVKMTVDAQLATDLSNTETAKPTTTDTQSPSDTPNPTDTPNPSNTPEPTDTEAPPPTESGNGPPPDYDDLIDNANILLFEDMTKLFETRYVKEALDSMGLSDNYTDVKDAVGHFKTQLLSGIHWDLILVAVEARTGVQGEFFTYLNDQLNEGTSVVMEHWNLDDLSAGKVSSILTRCGIAIQADWWDPPNSARSIWYLQGEHPIFHYPNEGMSLTNYTLYWFFDAGDLIKKLPGSKATLLAGTIATEKSSYGTLAVCIDGRFTLQTYSSHDYHRDDVVRLWQNFIYNALIAHFDYDKTHH